MDKRDIIAVIGTRGFPDVQGGVERHCQSLYGLLADYVTPRVYRRKPYVKAAAKHDGIEFVDLPSTRIAGVETLLHTFLCVWHVWRHKPRLVHLHNIGPGVFAPLFKWMGLPVVLTYHSANYEHNKWNRLERAFLRWCECVALRNSDRIIFVNRLQMEKFPDSVQQRAVAIPNGVWPAQRTASTAFLEQQGITPGNYLLAVGRITPEKGLRYLVEAVNHPDRLKYPLKRGEVSSAGYHRQLMRLDTKGKVIYTGYANEAQLTELYNHARAFVLASVNEGLPIVLLEAMSHGLPIVATDLPATRVVKLPEHCYCASGDTAALRDAIARCLSQAHDGPTTYDLTAFDWVKIAQATLGIYNDTLQQPQK